MAVAISVLGNAVRDMIVSVTQTRLLLENVMPRTPSDQPNNSDLFYRAGRWIAVAIVSGRPFRKLAIWQSEHDAPSP
jgi:hypothetical protein